MAVIVHIVGIRDIALPIHCEYDIHTVSVSVRSCGLVEAVGLAGFQFSFDHMLGRGAYPLLDPVLAGSGYFIEFAGCAQYFISGEILFAEGNSVVALLICHDNIHAFAVVADREFYIFCRKISVRRCYLMQVISVVCL